MAQVSLAWMLSKDIISAPIVGTTNLKNLEDIAGVYAVCMLHFWPELMSVCVLDAVHVTLSESEIKKLEEPYKAQAVVKLW